MGYLLHIVVAIVGLAVAEAEPWPTWSRPWLVLLFCALPHALAGFARNRFLKGRFTTSFLLIRAIHACAPLLYFVAVSFLGWRETVEHWLGREVSLLAWPELGLFVLLAPFIAYELLAIDAQSRCLSASTRDRRATRGFQMRMFASTVVPLAVYILVAACIGWSEELRVNIEEVAAYHAAFAAFLLLSLAFLLPTILRHTWKTTPLAPGVQRDLLVTVARRAGFESHEILVWLTGNTMANAAIVGVGRGRRVVLFSDALLVQLELGELAAVFAHEIGHARRHHVPIFAAWTFGFFLSADLASSFAFGDGSWLAGAATLAALVAWYFLIGYVSRRFELDADIYSVDLLGDAESLVRALERVGGRFRDVASWRHFSTARRVDFIRTAVANPAVGRRLQKSVITMAWLGCILFVSASALQTCRLVDAHPEDMLRVDLRLGRYASAVERARAMNASDSELGVLAARGASLSSTTGDTAEIEAHARAALAQRDIETAREWLELGRLRGRRDLEAVGDAIDAASTGDVADPREALPSDLYAAWQAELAGIGAAESNGPER